MEEYSVYVELVPFVIRILAEDKDDALVKANAMVKTFSTNNLVKSNIYCDEAWIEEEE